MEALSVKAFIVDAEQVAKLHIPQLRSAEAAAFAVFEKTLEGALVENVAASMESIVVTVNDEVAVVWGHSCRNFSAGIGFGWMITTPVVDRYKMRFARSAYRIIEYLMSVYYRLEVVVDADHLVSLAWLERMGFISYLPAITVNGHSFIYLAKERE